MAAKLHKWHRRIGLIASAFIIFLVLTGIVLQHSDDFNLPNIHLSNSWLLKYYGIKPNPITTYQLGNLTISHAGETIYLSGKPITSPHENIYGAVKLAQQIIIAVDTSLLVTDLDGNLIDEISTQDGLVEAPLGIAISNSKQLVIRGVNTYWHGDSHFTKWETLQEPHPEWSSPDITLPALRQVIEAKDMSNQISIERFILDAHSGRVFGKYGIWVIDAAAILLLILSLTGIWLWASRR
jgi:di/tricarboxylate transporter